MSTFQGVVLAGLNNGELLSWTCWMWVLALLRLTEVLITVGTGGWVGELVNQGAYLLEDFNRWWPVAYKSIFDAQQLQNQFYCCLLVPHGLYGVLIEDLICFSRGVAIVTVHSRRHSPVLDNDKLP